MNKLVEEIREWSGKHLKQEEAYGQPFAGMWGKTWFKSAEHLLVKMRVVEHDFGGWIILLSCSASHGANESDWKGINLGDIKSTQQLDRLLEWLEDSVKG